ERSEGVESVMGGNVRLALSKVNLSNRQIAGDQLCAAPEIVATGLIWRIFTCSDSSLMKSNLFISSILDIAQEIVSKECTPRATPRPERPTRERTVKSR